MAIAPTTYWDFHRRIIRETFDREISDRDAFLLFTILIYHRFVLSSPQLLTDYADRPDVRDVRVVFPPLEPRRCAERVACLWEGEQDIRAEPSHWQIRWSEEWGGYRRARHLSPEELGRLYELLERLRRHPLVGGIVADGSQPFPTLG
jgi:hypothetical protein